ncbi:MAG: DUF47 domain-containing protein [Chloroflexi bacterium]|nr:DUF47 domain-containing protein [Chloroflexota bacterium]
MGLWSALTSVLTREDRFFGLLRSSANNIHDTALLLVDLLEDYRDVHAKVAEIKRLEEVGDHLIHEIMRNLHRTFVTPLDREDIAALGERLDDVVDSIEEACRNMVEYEISGPTEASKELAQIILRASEVLQSAISKLHFRGSKLREILPDAVELNRLENEADQIASRAVAALFNDSISPIEVMKWRDIYQQLEMATDRCEDAANVLEGVVLKNG